jgi:hypothetical protein
MTFRRRFAAPASLLLVVVILAACSTPAPTVEPSRTPSPSELAASRDAFNTAICPIFDEIVALDSRLEALRETGASGDEERLDIDELNAVIDKLGIQLDALENVPEWDAGQSLRFQVETALHGIRARLLQARDEAEATDALARLAALPFIASQALDLAMAQAVEGGHRCGS